MNKSIVKPIVAGILLGAAAFFMPFFLLRTILFFGVIGILFRLFIGRRMRAGFGGRAFQPAFADKIRNMSDEEYAAFKSRFQGNCGHHRAKQEATTN